MKTRYFAILRIFVLFTALSLFAAGCGSNSTTTANNTGSVTAKLVWDVSGNPTQAKTTAKAAAGVVTIRVIVSAADMSDIQKDFVESAGSGTVDGIPAGTGRTFKVLGLESTGLVRYQSQVNNITIRAGQNTDVGTIIMQQIAYILSGQVQKGPLIFGSSIWVSELDATLNPNGKTYIAQTNDDLGNFYVGPNIGSNLIELLGVGYYMDELTGALSTSTITLSAVADLSVYPTPIINILTTLQRPRLKSLILKGQTYQAAMLLSQTEALAAFGIDATKISSFKSLSAMQINGTSDQDSVLLATSAILSKMATNAATANGSSQAAELTYFLSRIASDLQNGGALSNASIIAARNLAATQLDLAAVRSNVETYYANRGVTIVAPKFEEWVDKDGSGVLPRRLVPATGLSFTDTSGVEPNQSITSNIITVSGLGAGVAAPVLSSTGTTIIKNGTAVSGTITTTKDGDTIALSVTSAGYGLTNSWTISIGSSTATWRVTSKPLGGTVRMLTGTGLVLQNNGGDNITIPAGSTSFNFNATVANGASYNVSVLSQPTNLAQVCTVSKGTGTVGAAQSNVIVSCAGPVSELGFTDVSGVGPNQTITSNTITVGGLGSGIVATVTVDSSTTIIKNGAVSGTTTTAIDGDTIALRATSAGYGLTKTSTITIASSSATWRVVSSPLVGSISGLTGTGMVLQVNGGGNITIPPGSTSFTFSATVENAYNVSVLTQPTLPLQDCSVINGSGSASSAVSNISVVCSGVEVVHSISGSFRMNTASGAITRIGDGFVDATSIAIAPTGRFLYTIAYKDYPAKPNYNIFIYRINAFGVPTKIGTFTSEFLPLNIAIDPTGKFLYGLGSDGTNFGVNVFSINSTTGALTSIGFQPPNTLWPLIFDPTGKFVYSPYPDNFGSVTISSYSINSTTGALTSIGTGTIEGPSSITIGPSGKFVYVSRGLNLVSYSINSTTGALTSIGTIDIPAGYVSISIDPTGKFAYLTDSFTEASSLVYSINASTGALTPNTGAPFPVGTGGVIGFDLTGKFAFTRSGSYSINQTTGVLTYIAGNGLSPEAIFTRVP